MTDPFAYFSEHPEQAQIFHDCMTDISLLNTPAIVEAYDFGRFGKIVDVGGSHGILIAAIGSTSDSWAAQPTSPRDIVQGNPSSEDIVGGPSALPLVHIGQLRADPALVQKILPTPPQVTP